jgi:hypothetical protein
MLPPLEDCRTLFKESVEAFEMVLCSRTRRKPLGFTMRVLVTSSRRGAMRGEQDDRGADEADGHAGHVPTVWPRALDQL